MLDAGLDVFFGNEKDLDREVAHPRICENFNKILKDDEISTNLIFISTFGSSSLSINHMIRPNIEAYTLDQL